MPRTTFTIYILLTFAILIVASSWNFVVAQTSQPLNTAPRSYVLTLLYDNGKLELPDDDSSIDPSPELYAAPAPKNYLFYTAELYDKEGNLLVSGPIDQKQNFGQVVDPPYGPENGWVQITAPYDESATRIVIKDYSRAAVFDHPLYNTTVFAPKNTEEFSQVEQNIPRPSFWHDNWILALLIGAVIIVGASLGFVVFRYYRRNS